jgi:hypothetical protein
MATYLNDLRLKEITTGDESGTWGTSTNTNLSLIADAFSLGTKQMAANADETFTMPDATADGTRSLYLKITSAVSLTATRTVTLAPNTVSKVWIIENATTGSQSIIIKQGSGATVTVATGTKVMVVTDGAGAGAAVTNANPTAATSGTVTSVAATVPSLLSVAGSPITSSGTLAFTYSGTALPVANGGTGATTLTASGYLKGAGTSAITSQSGIPAGDITTGTLGVARGGTGAATLTANNVLLGNGTSAPLFVAPSTAGNVLTSNGTTWTSAAASGGLGSGGTTATGSVTLTSASDAMQSITTTGYGQSVTLPNATTCSEGVQVFAVANRGPFPLLIKNTSGTLLGYVPLQGYVLCSLADKSTAAGVWDLFGEVPYGPDAGGVVTFGTADDIAATIAVTLDADRTVIFVSNSIAVQAIVYNSSTQAFGSSVLVRSAAISNRMSAIKSATDRVLIVSCTVTTGMQAVVLSISGTAITVNTAATLTLANNCSAIGNGSQNGSAIVQVGSSFVVPYNDGPGNKGMLVAITISGTTPSFGSESIVLYSSSNALPIIYDINGTVCLVFSNNGVTFGAAPYTVSGTTLTQGTVGSFAIDSNNFFVTTVGSRWAVLYRDTNMRGAIISVASTTATVSTVQLGSGTASARQVMEVNGSNIVCVADNNDNPLSVYVNVLTDTAGTASAGTEVVLTPLAGTSPGIYGYATDGIYYGFYATASLYTTFKLSNSGAQPTVTALKTYSGVVGTTFGLPPVQTNGRNANTQARILLSGENSYNVDLTDYTFDSVSGYAIPAPYKWESLESNGVFAIAANQTWLCRNASGSPTDRVFTLIRYTAV